MLPISALTAPSKKSKLPPVTFREVLQAGCSSCALFCFAYVLWVLSHIRPDEIVRHTLVAAAGDDHFSDGVQAAAMAAGVHFGDDDLLFDAKAAVQASQAGRLQAVHQCLLHR